MSDEPELKKDSTISCAQVFLFFVLAVLLIFSVSFIINEFSRDTTTVGAPRTNFTLGCPIAGYQDDAQPLVGQLVRKLDDTDLNDRGDLSELRATVRTLQRQAEQMDVPDCLALKHETLVFTFVHTERAMDAMLSGDTSEASQALNRATMNLERFSDWTVDIGD